MNRWGERSRRDGHEVFLSIPMEPVNYPQNDPGALTLLTSHSQRESTNILRQSLGRMTGYVGVLNHMGSRFTAASDSLRPILDEINRRGLMFVDSRTTPYSRAAAMGRAMGLPVALNNGYIDKELAPDLIAEELKKLEVRAQTQGAAMGMARPYPVSINAIKVWVATLEERGFVLVPVTSIANRQAIPR
ncbi:MAG: divergent polysaccharide deacetylase family protein [Kordiimonas sp.]